MCRRFVRVYEVQIVRCAWLKVFFPHRTSIDAIESTAFFFSRLFSGSGTLCDESLNSPSRRRDEESYDLSATVTQGISNQGKQSAAPKARKSFERAKTRGPSVSRITTSAIRERL